MGGLLSHPDKKHIIYPLGSTVIVKESGVDSAGQWFLEEHTGPISCVAIARNGSLIAYGQQTRSGLRVTTLVF